MKNEFNDDIDSKNSIQEDLTNQEETSVMVREKIVEKGGKDPKRDWFASEKVTIGDRPSSPPIFRSKKWLWLLSLIAVFGLGAIAFNRLKNPPSETLEIGENTSVQAKLPVKAIRVQTAPIQDWVFSDGFVEAVQGKHLTFEVEGTISYLRKIEGRDLREGDFVSQGELLAQVDQRKLASDVTVSQAQVQEAQQQLSTAIANLQQNQSVLQSREADLASARADLASARADLQKAQANLNFARTDLNRYQQLWEDGVVAETDRDTRDTAFQEAQANVEATRSQVSAREQSVRAAHAAIEAQQATIISAQAQVESAKSGIQSAIANLNKSQVILEDTEIVAPFNGIVAYLNIREGDYWSPQRINAAGEYQQIVESVPIIVIDPSEFEVIVELPSFDGAKVQPNQRAFIILNENLDAANSSQLSSEDLIVLASAEGRVFSVSPSVTPGGRAIEVSIRINRGTQNLKHGSRVSVWIAVEEKNNATVAPFSAFVFRDQKPHVFAVNEAEGVVEQREIIQGIRGISNREILQGVKPGELLVTEGKNSLVDGAPVEVIDVIE